MTGNSHTLPPIYMKIPNITGIHGDSPMHISFIGMWYLLQLSKTYIYT